MNGPKEEVFEWKSIGWQRYNAKKVLLLKIEWIRLKPNIFSLLTRKLYALTPIFMSVQAVEKFEGYAVININSTLNMTLNNLINQKKRWMNIHLGVSPKGPEA